MSKDETPLRSAADIDLTRRDFLISAAVTVAGVNLAASSVDAAESPPVGVEVETSVTLDVNGVAHTVQLDTRATLLDTLRERLGLTGTKKGCDRGECGACTVHIDGRRVLSCMTLSVMAQGRQITTIEGLAAGEKLHPVQAAFIEHDAFQCGYCTSGQIMSAVACIREGHARSDEEIREFMSGNICRCSCYPQIVAAVKSAAAPREV
jgi:xanthine dehydrogenase YagT iron-sulfur-binding subunit